MTNYIERIRAIVVKAETTFNTNPIAAEETDPIRLPFMADGTTIPVDVPIELLRDDDPQFSQMTRQVKAGLQPPIDFTIALWLTGSGVGVPASTDDPAAVSSSHFLYTLLNGAFTRLGNAAGSHATGSPTVGSFDVEATEGSRFVAGNLVYVPNGSAFEANFVEAVSGTTLTFSRDFTFTPTASGTATGAVYNSLTWRPNVLFGDSLTLAGSSATFTFIVYDHNYSKYTLTGAALRNLRIQMTANKALRVLLDFRANAMTRATSTAQASPAIPIDYSTTPFPDEQPILMQNVVARRNTEGTARSLKLVEFELDMGMDIAAREDRGGPQGRSGWVQTNAGGDARLKLGVIHDSDDVTTDLIDNMTSPATDEYSICVANSVGHAFGVLVPVGQIMASTRGNVGGIATQQIEVAGLRPTSLYSHNIYFGVG